MVNLSSGLFGVIDENILLEVPVGGIKNVPSVRREARL